MKKEVKDRIKALNIAIDAIDKRILDLRKIIRPETCPLCQRVTQGAWGCDTCPAHKADYSCNQYGLDVEQIHDNLFLQKQTFNAELVKLMAGTKQ